MQTAEGGPPDPGPGGGQKYKLHETVCSLEVWLQCDQCPAQSHLVGEGNGCEGLGRGRRLMAFFNSYPCPMKMRL